MTTTLEDDFYRPAESRAAAETWVMTPAPKEGRQTAPQEKNRAKSERSGMCEQKEGRQKVNRQVKVCRGRPTSSTSRRRRPCGTSSPGQSGCGLSSWRRMRTSAGNLEADLRPTAEDSLEADHGWSTEGRELPATLLAALDVDGQGENVPVALQIQAHANDSQSQATTAHASQQYCITPHANSRVAVEGRRLAAGRT